MSEYDEYRDYQNRKSRGGGQRKHAADSGGRHAKSGDPDNCMVVAPIPGIAVGLLFLLGRTLVRQAQGRA
ncbi:hypothetical protein HHL19_36475 [Streptomyces sp. R302]|uniref:hypothetical protein n=1 Tax=unclassified Streptomyces TaxID=2593676 RepID=UPI00145C4AB8|nr:MULTISPECIES: hypothetical protein [unclassified Streptomyces]NML55650.1 hypothetical protein [Streptomyces sp. R301]NML84008.1 hypothetical protein [Streptomyces sp. R302]